MKKRRPTKKHSGKAQSRSSQYCYEFPRPSVTADSVIFRQTKRRLEVLLIKRGSEPYENYWSIPGGFVNENEPLEAAAARELEEETGLSGIPLRQVAAFGEPGRDPRGHTVTIVFTGVAKNDSEPRAADDAADAGWFAARRPPRLAFDHAEILREVLRHVVKRKRRG